MKYREMHSFYNDLTFVIEEDKPNVGAYLYVYKDKECIYDYLQNSIQDSIGFAYEEFGVPEDSWIEK